MSSTTNFAQSEFRYDEGKSPLALLAETCRNIGVDTTTSKLAKSSMDHVKSSTNSSSSSSSLSSSSSSSIDSSSRKKNDSCRLSVSPLRNTTPVSPTSRSSANSVNGTNPNTTNNNNTNANNSTIPNVNINVSTTSNHSSLSTSSSSGTHIGNSVTNLSNSESGCSFKPYEDHIISKKKKIRSTPVHESDNKNRHVNNTSKHNYLNDSESFTKTHESNSSNKREIVKSSSNHVSTLTSHSSSSSTSSSAIPTSSSSTTTSTSTAHGSSSSSTPSKGSNCNGCLPPHTPTSTPHPLSVDSVAKFVPYPSLSPYLGLPPPPPTGYDPASVAAVAAAVACHSPSMCRDPYCAGCRFNPANVLGQVSTCPAGCTQCSHVTSQMTSSMSHQLAALQANGYLAGNAFYPPPPHHHQQQPHHQHQHHHPGNPPTSSSASSPHSTSAAAAAVANGKPNICSWMIGNTYCGKRLNSSEELHQHLRNHTSSDPTSVSALAFLGQYPHLYPMLINPIAGLRRTAFDPVSRYHPYKSMTSNGGSPLSTLPNGLGAIHKPPPPSGSQLNMHYPPYGPIKLMLEK